MNLFNSLLTGELGLLAIIRFSTKNVFLLCFEDTTRQHVVGKVLGWDLIGKIRSWEMIGKI